jgi:hypothetical protein
MPIQRTTSTKNYKASELQVLAAKQTPRKPVLSVTEQIKQTQAQLVTLQAAADKRAESAKKATLTMAGIKVAGSKAAGSPEQINKPSLIPTPKATPQAVASNDLVMGLIHAHNAKYRAQRRG